MSPTMSYLERPWRVGRKLLRTVYALVGEEASLDDEFLGIFDSPAIAAAVVVEHNRQLERLERE